MSDEIRQVLRDIEELEMALALYKDLAVVRAPLEAQLAEKCARLAALRAQIGDVVGGDKVLGDKIIQNFFGSSLDENISTSALHQLSSHIQTFVGREQEVDKLVQALRTAAASSTESAISGITGMGGIGKTELAYKAAHLLLNDFPGGQFVINLRGTSNNPMTPKEALQYVIRSFNCKISLPENISDLRNMYLSLLYSKRILVLADDAQDAAQVSELLPPAGCALLITSRNKFSLRGMETIDLDVLSPTHAKQFLLKELNDIGNYTEELAYLCGYLPLALQICASLLKSSYDVKKYLEQLRIERLKNLSHTDNPNDSQASVEASLRLSYDALTSTAQSMLCQISVFSASFDLKAVQAVVLIEDDITKMLELLNSRSLLKWDVTTRRCSLNNLVRVFVIAQLKHTDELLKRHARYYAEVAKYAGQIYYAGGKTHLAGLILLDQEHIHINDSWAWTAKNLHSSDTYSIQCSHVTALNAFLNIRFLEQPERIIEPLKKIVEIARLRGEKFELGQACNVLGTAYKVRGDGTKAIIYYQEAYAVAQELGIIQMQCSCLNNIGLVYAKLRFNGNFDKRFFDRAMIYLEQARTIARKHGDKHREGQALNNIGIAYASAGDIRSAISFFRQFLDITVELDDYPGMCGTLGNLGRAAFDLDRLDEAIELYERAISIAKQLNNSEQEANYSWSLGLIYEKKDDVMKAAELMQVYVDYLNRIDHPNAKLCAAEVEQLNRHLGYQKNWRGLWRWLKVKKPE